MATTNSRVLLSREADWLSRNVFMAPEGRDIRRHASIRRRYQAMQISKSAWFKIFVASLILGLAAYGGVVAFSYAHTANAMQISVATFSLSWKPSLAPDTAAALTLEDLGIVGDDDLKKELISAMDTVRSEINGGNSALNHLPALALATRLVKATVTGNCSTCEQNCDRALQPVLTRLLLGWPTTAMGRAADVDFVHKRAGGITGSGSSRASDQSNKERACREVIALQSLTPSLLSPALLWGRQEPWPAPLVAQLALGADSCISSVNLLRDRCVLVTRLFQTVIDDADIKFDRAFLVDFFYGWERALVAILIFIVTLALSRQRKARRRLEIEAQWVQKQLENPRLKVGLDPTDSGDTISPPVAAMALRESFKEIFTPTFDGTAGEPVAEIVVAAAEAVTQQDLKYLQTFVDRNLAEMEESRELINSIITIFPVIGFSATLLSLVHALSGANQIATSSGDLRSAAILNVTSLLSSCFATTFLALVSMAIFVVLNLLEGAKDRRLLTTLSERLISAFRPGRRYLLDGAQRP
jgi:hypothetical protein